MALMNTTGITLLGLGPGAADLLTRQAWDLLLQIPEIYLQTSKHPAVADFPQTLQVYSLDQLSAADLVAQVIELGRHPQGVVFGVPGHPLVANPISLEIVRRSREEGLPLQVVAGMGFLEATGAVLGIDLLPQTTLVDAEEVLRYHTPLFPPHTPALILNLNASNAQRLQAVLEHVYPQNHPLHLVDAAGVAIRFPAE